MVFSLTADANPKCIACLFIDVRNRKIHNAANVKYWFFKTNSYISLEKKLPWKPLTTKHMAANLTPKAGCRKMIQGSEHLPTPKQSLCTAEGRHGSPRSLPGCWDENQVEGQEKRTYVPALLATQSSSALAVPRTSSSVNNGTHAAMQSERKEKQKGRRGEGRGERERVSNLTLQSRREKRGGRG